MVNKYYEKHEERLRNEARERYQSFSGKEKDKMRKKARERFILGILGEGGGWG